MQIRFLFPIQYHKDFVVSKQKIDRYGHQFNPKELLDSENGSVFTLYMYQKLLHLVFHLEMYWKTHEKDNRRSIWWSVQHQKET